MNKVDSSISAINGKPLICFSCFSKEADSDYGYSDLSELVEDLFSIDRYEYDPIMECNVCKVAKSLQKLGYIFKSSSLCADQLRQIKK